MRMPEPDCSRFMHSNDQPSADASSVAFDHKSFLNGLTGRPGVYRMIGSDGELLYVGKARNLKKRVSSYFLRASGSERIESMVSQIRNIEVTVTHTEDEALILENTLIKRHRPRYNVLLRDDKSYPYLYLSTDHAFPRLSFRRGAKHRAGRFFGPYPSASAVRQSIKSLQQAFRLRQCDDTFFANRSRPCLQYQIKRCSAPCVGFISEADYRRDVDSTMKFLEGKSEQVTRDLEARMEAASQALEFESAARYRDRIAVLRRLQDRHYVYGRNTSMDIVCVNIRSGLAGAVVVAVRNGHHLGHRSYFPSVPPGTDRAELLAGFLGQYYLERKAPPDILVELEPTERNWLEEAFSAQAGRHVRIRYRLRGVRARWREGAQETLEQALAARLATSTGVSRRLAALQEALGLEALPGRMECFDISHTRGELAVASCVVFEDGVPLKSAYRRFNIEGIEPGDDYAAIRQAVGRRFTRLKRGEAMLPDVLLIDGGRGQLRQATDVLKELQVEGVALVGVAKGVTRKPGLEQLFLPGREAPLILAADSPALHLIQQIRDESHRFAITGHRRRREHARTRSALEDIEGLGPKRRQRLLKAFGGVRQVTSAGVDELMRVEGISREMAHRIYDYFHASV